MKPEDLTKDAREKIVALHEAIRRALDANPNTPHAEIVSPSSMPSGSTGVLNGANIVTYQKPPLAYDEREVRLAHQAIYEATAGTLYGIIVRARRGDAGSWELKTKLVSLAEHEALQSARRGIDERVEAELRSLADVPGFRWISFGRWSRSKPAQVTLAHSDRVDHVEPTAVLSDLGAMAEAIYHDAGLVPVALNWTLSDAFDVMEYFE